MATAKEYAALPREERIARLRRTPDELADAIAGATPEALVRRPAPASWAALEVLCHLRDTEEDFRRRLELARENDEPKYPSIDPPRWAEERQYLRNDPAAVLAAFRRRREELLAFYGSLAPHEWSRGGTIITRRRATIEEYLAGIAAHDDNHLDQLRRALAGTP